MGGMRPALVLLATIALAGCTVRSERVVEVWRDAGEPAALEGQDAAPATATDERDAEADAALEGRDAGVDAELGDRDADAGCAYYDPHTNRCL